MKHAVSMSEAELQQHVVKLLEAYARPDICFFHPANGEARHVTIGRKLKRMGVKKGVADLMLTISGRSVAMELKTEIGTQSREQAEWQEEFERAGGHYILVRGLDEAIRMLAALNVFREGVTFCISSASFSSTSDGREARRGSDAVSRYRSPDTSNSPFTSEPATP